MLLIVQLESFVESDKMRGVYGKICNWEGSTLCLWFPKSSFSLLTEAVTAIVYLQMFAYF